MRAVVASLTEFYNTFIFIRSFDPCVQESDRIIVTMDDGFNLVQYAFKMQASGPKQTLVECQVSGTL